MTSKSPPLNFRALAMALLSVIFLAAAMPAMAQADLTVRFVTFNVNFNNSAKKIRQDVETVSAHADVMMFQEAKTVTIDDFLDSSWTVYQVVNNGDARRGSAVAIRNSILKTKLGQGLVLGVRAGDAAMLDRYIAWMDVELTNNTRLRIMSLHMPPDRFKDLQPPMATSLVNFANASTYPVVVGGDWNYKVTSDPYNISTRANLVARGVGIDGFYHDNSVVKFKSITKLNNLVINSDHDPVQLVTTVKASPSSCIFNWSLYQ